MDEWSEKDNANPFAQPLWVDRLQERLAVLLMGALALLVLWVLVGALSSIWLTTKVPLTALDMEHASWLFSYTTSSYVSTVLFGTVTIGFAFMGVMIGFAKSDWKMPVASCVLAALLWPAGSMESMARAGIDSGAVKIGCYVYAARECRQMLGLGATTQAPARWESTREPEISMREADWYLKAARPLKVGFFDVVPAGHLFQMPFLLFRVDELNQKIAAQRAEVAEFQRLNKGDAVAQAGDAILAK